MKTFANRVFVVSALVLSCATFAFSQSYRNLSTVHDGSGTMSTNTVLLGGVNYRHVSAAGQPGGIFTNANGTLNNYAGFLQAVDIKKWNQVDIYGNPYELTPDNDVDGLSDLAEVQGTNFSPTTATDVNNPDTDGDGVSDMQEQAAQSDPTDPSAYLRILSIRNTGDNRQVTFLARDSKQYRVWADDASYRIVDSVLGTNQEFGGTGLWLVRTNTIVDTVATNARFYAVEPMR